ncbi:MAG TPA: hypothetical protein VHY37_10020 [Tepidisphaeraceae bacterium]|jgi:hypothetical protein|nr:hypothetical protein [Tepidisphaeraceae bacterium]
MGFDRGSMSFRRFAVVGSSPDAPDQAIIDTLSEYALRPSDATAGVDVEVGWSGGRHILDASFSFEHNVFAECVHAAMRVDTNKVPSELRKAYKLMEEEAAASGNPSGFASKRQKRDAADTAARQIDEDLHSGKYRRSKLVPLLWDMPAKIVYCNASNTMTEKLSELFERSFGLELEPISAGSLASRLLQSTGKRRDYEDFRPTRFATLAGAESQAAEYPWVAKGAEAKDFLGNEFLLWLWHEADQRTGIVAADAAGDVSIFIDRVLELDCSFGESGRDLLRGTGPSRMPEARDALRSGKVPRKAGLILDASNMQFNFTLSAESFAIATAKLPDVPEADTPRVLFEERIALLREFGKTIDGLFTAFLKQRAASSWESQANAMRRWIASTKNVAAA